MARSFPLATCLIVAAMATALSAGEFAVQETPEGAVITLDGKLVTNYITKSGAKPILWPLIGPTGKEMTRGYPMQPATVDEKADHPHHRSFWFTHGDVNGVDFWSEGENHGNIVHRNFLKLEGGPQGVVAAVNDWLSSKGDKVCEEERTFVFGANDEARWIDVDLLIKASNGPVVFGDTKEGSFGVRVAGPLDVDAKKGGRIVNSEGQSDDAAWGKPAAWVDYYGPIDGDVLGIAIMNHPTSFRFPTPWHVRTYGLFAANPFGLHDFNKGEGPSGSHTIANGETMRLRYRVVLHRGDEKAGRIAELFTDYSNSK